MEVRGTVAGVTVYDDFAHHPTAIATTVDGLRRRVGRDRILAVLEPRSNTMKLGMMKDALPASLREADRVYCYAGNVDWDVARALAPLGDKAEVHADLDALVGAVARAAHAGDHVLVMSNGGFGGVHDRLLRTLAARS
jgi:UDP-N-acetylmuramate: L-alanyl-gamma-D-glutamyl-meso-diaminopimelate ligase